MNAPVVKLRRSLSKSRHDRDSKNRRAARQERPPPRICTL